MLSLNELKNKDFEGFLVLDSNVWIAFLYEKDPNHNKAAKVFEVLKAKIILTEYVFLEVVTVLSQKAGKDVSDNFIKNVTNNQDIIILPSSGDFLGEIVNFYLSKKIEKLSFVDYSLLCLSQKFKVITFDKALQRHLKKHRN